MLMLQCRLVVIAAMFSSRKVLRFKAVLFQTLDVQPSSSRSAAPGKTVGLSEVWSLVEL